LPEGRDQKARRTFVHFASIMYKFTTFLSAFQVLVSGQGLGSGGAGRRLTDTAAADGLPDGFKTNLSAFFLFDLQQITHIH
jgi:hypothetical protein